eukprot:scaffold248367_cov40-Prasinocladus_malaysianus.AAC.1
MQINLYEVLVVVNNVSGERRYDVATMYEIKYEHSYNICYVPPLLHRTRMVTSMTALRYTVLLSPPYSSSYRTAP